MCHQNVRSSLEVDLQLSELVLFVPGSELHSRKAGECLVEVDIPETLADVIGLPEAVFMGA